MKLLQGVKQFWADLNIIFAIIGLVSENYVIEVTNTIFNKSSSLLHFFIENHVVEIKTVDSTLKTIFI